MSTIADHFSTDDLVSVQRGIDTFIRLTGLIYDPSPLVWNKWFTDEGDLKSALRSVRDTLVASQTMMGKRKYQGIDYNWCKEAKKDLLTFLTSGADAGEVAHLKKCNLPMYYLVIEPTIDLFAGFEHDEVILFAPEIIDGICKMVDSSTNYGTYAQALEAQTEVRKLMAAREEAKAAESNKRKPRKKAQDPILALLAALAQEPIAEGEEEEEVAEL